jgi:anti-sigma-K factor RskA
MSHDPHSLLAPYALDALDDHERAEFEHHLAGCALCQEELPGLVATAIRLGDAAAEGPPSYVRAAVLNAAHYTPQRHPLLARRTVMSRVRRYSSAVAVAACLAVAAAATVAYMQERNETAQLRAEKAAMTAIMTSSNATMRAMSMPGGGNLRLIASEHGAMLVATDVPAVPSKVYQVWTLRAGKATSHGVIDRSNSMRMLGTVTDGDTIAITLEPPGGSSAPTSDPIMSADV